MKELTIHKHNFEVAKNHVKSFSENLPGDLSINRVDSENSHWFWFSTTHNVTGSELNEITAQIQNNLISLRNIQRDLIKQFGEVYKAFEALDKDYMDSIIISIKAAEKANEEALIAQAGIEENVSRIKKIIDVLQKFKTKFDEYDHIFDVDNMWDDLRKFKTTVNECIQSIKSLNSFKGDIESIIHINDVDLIWKDVNDTKETLHAVKADIAKLESFKGDIENINHINDVDKMFKNMELISKYLDDLKTENIKQENTIALLKGELATNASELALVKGELSSKLKTAYILSGGAMAAAIVLAFLR